LTTNIQAGGQSPGNQFQSTRIDATEIRRARTVPWTGSAVIGLVLLDWHYRDWHYRDLTQTIGSVSFLRHYRRSRACGSSQGKYPVSVTRFAR